MKAVVVLSAFALAIGGAVATADPAHHGGPAKPAPAAGAMQPGGTGMMGMMRMMGMTCPMMSGHVEGKLAFLKAELKITESQSSAWETFADAYKAFAASKSSTMMQGGMMGGGMMSGGRPMGGGPGEPDHNASYPDQMKTHMQMIQDHMAAGQKFAPAVDSLYRALSAEQRKSADELLPMFTMMGGMM